MRSLVSTIMGYLDDYMAGSLWWPAMNYMPTFGTVRSES